MPPGSKNILLIPWQTGVTPSANKAFSYSGSKQENRSAGDNDEFVGGTTMNKHPRKDESAGDGSPSSLYPLITATAMLATHADVSRSVLETTPYLLYCALYILCVCQFMH